MAEPQRDLTPEQAAKRLSECDEVHYLDKIDEDKWNSYTVALKWITTVMVVTIFEYLTENLILEYCRIQINSSVTRHGPDVPK